MGKLVQLSSEQKMYTQRMKFSSGQMVSVHSIALLLTHINGAHDNGHYDFIDVYQVLEFEGIIKATEMYYCFFAVT